jgi:hypothetical protein
MKMMEMMKAETASFIISLTPSSSSALFPP